MNLLNPNLPPNTVKARQLRAVVLDWAGTIVDHGSLAPVKTLQHLFSSVGIDLREDDARQHMGLPKREHIRSLLQLPHMAELWKLQTGQNVQERDVDELFARFVPLQFACLAEYSGLIPGVTDAVDRMRRRGLQIATTTGYTRGMLDVLIAQAKIAGFEADTNLSPEDVGGGRPKPFMIYQHAITLNVFPMAAIVKVGDTVADIEEGLNAGAWSVGVAATGNMIGLSLETFAALPDDCKASLLGKAHAALASAGAHFVVNSVAKLDPVLDAINQLLQTDDPGTKNE